jgi:hypothetical protein
MARHSPGASHGAVDAQSAMEDTFDGMHVTNPVARHEKQARVVQNVSSSLVWAERLLSTERAAQFCDNSFAQIRLV